MDVSFDAAFSLSRAICALRALNAARDASSAVTSCVASSTTVSLGHSVGRALLSNCA